MSAQRYNTQAAYKRNTHSGAQFVRRLLERSADPMDLGEHLCLSSPHLHPQLHPHAHSRFWNPDGSHRKGKPGAGQLGPSRTRARDKCPGYAALTLPQRCCARMTSRGRLWPRNVDEVEVMKLDLAAIPFGLHTKALSATPDLPRSVRPSLVTTSPCPRRCFRLSGPRCSAW